MVEQSEVINLKAEIANYDPLIQKGFELLSDVNKPSLIHALKHCGIGPDVKVSQIRNNDDWSKLTNDGKNFWMSISKGNIYLSQESWRQLTGPLASESAVFKDVDTLQHSIMLAFDISIPNSILRVLYLNARKIQPVIQTLYGYEPYNIMDLPAEEYAREKALADAKAVEYGQRYQLHIEALLKKSPYQAANAILSLQGNINYKVQRAIHDLLVKGFALTVDTMVLHSFETLADATRELVQQFQSPNCTDEQKGKIRRYLALYFAKIEEVNASTNTFIQSLQEKYEKAQAEETVTA